MKKFLFLLLLLVPLAVGVAPAQGLEVDVPGVVKADLDDLEITYTNYLSTSDDTTDNWSSANINALQTMIGLAREVYLYGVATDSVAADVYVLLRNSAVTALTSSYADSIIGTTDNANNVRVITLKDATVNRMTIYDQIKIGTVFRATGNGFLSGRTLKWRLKIVL